MPTDTTPPGDTTPDADAAAGFESNPRAGVEPASIATRPRGVADDGEFELNPVVRTYDPDALRTAPESERVREAVRQVLAEGRFLGDVTRELGLAPSSIYKWEKRYLDFVAGQTGSEPITTLHDWAGLADLPAEFKVRFAENWEQMVEVTHAEAADFRQDPLEVFLHNSMITGWLFRDGRLDASAALGAAVGVLFTLLVATFFYTKATETDAPAPVVAPAPASTYTDERPADEAEIQAARPVALAFIAADGWEQKLQFVREPERVRPLMQEWYATHSAAAQDKPELTHAMREGNVVHLLVQFPLDPSSTSLFFALVKGPDGYKVDWETSSGYQNKWWEELPVKRPTQPTALRCVLERADYWNFDFSDSEKWAAYHLAYPGGPVSLYGYVERGSQLANELDSLLVFRETAGVMIEVAYPPDSRAGNQVRILRFLHGAWITESTPSPTPPPK